MEIIQNKKEDKIIWEGLSTDTRNPNTMNLDEMSSLEIVEAMIKEDSKVPLIIKDLLPKISTVIDIAADTLKNKGRIFYMGAGISGKIRCGWFTTFNSSPNDVIELIAGGE